MSATPQRQNMAVSQIRRVAAYTRVRSWIHIIVIYLHFYAKINGFSLVKKALRKPKKAQNCTIYFKMFRGGGHAPWLP